MTDRSDDLEQATQKPVRNGAAKVSGLILAALAVLALLAYVIFG